MRLKITIFRVLNTGGDEKEKIDFERNFFL